MPERRAQLSGPAVRNEALDGLRALAVSMVLAYHAAPGLLPGGYLGVDVFFVLSGYFIARALGDGSCFHPGRYLMRRLQRLLPALLLVLAFCLALGWFVLLPQEYARLAQEAVVGLGFLTNAFPAAADYFGAGVESSALAHLWSLGVEMQVYLISACLLFPALRLFGPRRTYGAIFILSLALALRGEGDPQSFYNPASRGWEFALGALAAHAGGRLKPRAGGWVFTASLGVLVASGFLSLENHPGAAALIPALAAAAFIVTAASIPAGAVPQPVAVMGRASYAIYLWHWPILVFWGLHDLGPTGPDEAFLLVCLSILAGGLTYHLVERPCLSAARVPAVFAGIGLTGFLALVSALAVDAGRGFPGRLPEPARIVLKNTMRSHPELIRCHAISPGNIVLAENACLHNPAAGPARTALWGDSHAAALAGGLIRAGIPFREFSFSGCPPLPGYYTQARGPACLDHTEQSYKLILSDPGISTVILHARWPLYLEGPFDNGKGGREPLPGQRILDRQSGPVSPGSISARLESVVAGLSAAGKRVVLVTPTPAFGWDLRKAMARQAWHRQGIQISLPVLEHEDYTASTRAMLEGITRRVPDALLIDSTPVFCPAGDPFCKTSNGNSLLAFDQDHLSARGADLLAALILPRLDAARE